MSKQKSIRQMKKDVFGKTPPLVRLLAEVALEHYPALLGDFYKIVRTHSCRADRQVELVEHCMALVAAEGLQDSPQRREYLRQEAFRGARIDAQAKHQKEFSVGEVHEVCSGEDGYSVLLRGHLSIRAGAAPDGYEPQVGSEIWHLDVGSFCYGVVIDGHVFRYQTIAEQEAELQASIDCNR